ncbi:unnamed protein product [Bursaphelenchus okinawaensis]|uniref:Histone-lysine N-methyltransferase n=1 Tax=Bursaphelenchus okinawaensis TaxID=465554 RepID=A0A811KN12_9BILA|nr:unnamed protein product [Bursaphelenchus okinawaensis]CAG9105969.1 unnamed protein product [Bursaphelenchus okinawaensis]
MADPDENSPPSEGSSEYLSLASSNSSEIQDSQELKTVKPTFSVSNPARVIGLSRRQFVQEVVKQNNLAHIKKQKKANFRTAASNYTVDEFDIDSVTREREDLCFICQSFDERETTTCGVSGCNLFYHEHCLTREKIHDYFIFFHRDNRISCFKHFCNRCFSENKRTSACSSAPFYTCKMCPRSYHLECIPPGCDPTSVICPSHFRSVTTEAEHIPQCFCCARGLENDNRIDCDYCIRSFHDTCGQFVVAKRTGKGDRMCSFCQYGYFVPASSLCHVLYKGTFQPAKVTVRVKGNPGFVPVALMRDLIKNSFSVRLVKMVHHTRVLPFTFNDAYLKYYKKMKLRNMNVYLYLRQEMSTSDVSELPVLPVKSCYKDFSPCTENICLRKEFKDLLFEENNAHKCKCEVENGMKCLDSCVNRRQYYECNEDCGPECKNGPKSRDPNFDKLEVFECPVRGRGLRAKEHFVAGEPIGEYRGRLLTQKQVTEYMTIFCDCRNIEDHLYFMGIGNTGVTIDAKTRGSITRFANHSCEPNVKVVCVTGVDNMRRQMLYAKHDIKQGEEITFDYAMDWDEFNKICRCGKEQCSGYLNGRMQSRIKIIRTAEEYVPKVSRKRKVKRENDSSLSTRQC